jgi:hypothetical protein
MPVGWLAVFLVDLFRVDVFGLDLGWSIFPRPERMLDFRFLLLDLRFAMDLLSGF